MPKLARYAAKILLLSIFIGGPFDLYAQSSLHTAGGNATGPGGTVSFSVGQVAYQTITSADFSVSQGVQQPYEISVLTGSEAVSGINLMISAFPNPATDYLVLKFSEGDFKGYSYMLIDKAGKLLRSGDIMNYDTFLSLKGLASATYFFKVFKSKQEMKTFKIVKI
jgi:hypothetical protein